MRVCVRVCLCVYSNRCTDMEALQMFMNTVFLFHLG
jgi:hypothetical protein